jgi:hypothetical protein
MKNNINKANSVLEHWIDVLFCNALGHFRENDGVDKVLLDSKDGLNVRSIYLSNGDIIKVTVEYFVHNEDDRP